MPNRTRSQTLNPQAGTFCLSRRIAREAMEEKRREGMNPNPEQQDFLEAYLTQREDLKGQDRLILSE